MSSERLDAVQRCRFWNSGLQRKPLVDNQRIIAVASVEIIKRGRTLGYVAERQCRERRHAIGHVVGGLILAGGQRNSVGPARGTAKIETDIWPPPPAGTGP